MRLDDRLDERALLRFREHFDNLGLAHHVRWMDLELGGYEPDATERSLHRLLGDPPQRLLDAVTRARTRRGRVGVDAVGRIVTWPHFFVEPLHVLRDLSDRIGPVAGEVWVDLAPGSEPATLAFDGNVLLDVVEQLGIEIRHAARAAA